MTIQPVPTKRQRGGQPGNTNGFKHGFYAKQFKNAEIVDLNQTEKIDLQDEIDMLRVFMRRVSEKASPETNLWEYLEILRTLTFAAQCVNRLVRTQHALTVNAFPAILNQALDQVTRDLGIQ